MVGVFYEAGIASTRPGNGSADNRDYEFWRKVSKSVEELPNGDCTSHQTLQDMRPVTRVIPGVAFDKLTETLSSDASSCIRHNACCKLGRFSGDAAVYASGDEVLSASDEP